MAYCCAVQGDKVRTVQEVDGSTVAGGSFQGDGGKTRYKESPRGAWSAEVVKEMEGCAVDWGIGGRIVRMGLVLFLFLSLWASERFEKMGVVHEV